MSRTPAKKKSGATGGSLLRTGLRACLGLKAGYRSLLLGAIGRRRGALYIKCRENHRDTRKYVFSTMAPPACGYRDDPPHKRGADRFDAGTTCTRSVPVSLMGSPRMGLSVIRMTMAVVMTLLGRQRRV